MERLKRRHLRVVGEREFPSGTEAKETNLKLTELDNDRRSGHQQFSKNVFDTDADEKEKLTLTQREQLARLRERTRAHTATCAARVEQKLETAALFDDS